MTIFCDTLDDCRIAKSASCTTLLSYSPVYNGRGELVSDDPNTVTHTEVCYTCGRQWLVKTRSGKTTRVLQH